MNGINTIYPYPPEAARLLAIGIVYSLAGLLPGIDALGVLVDLDNPAYDDHKVAPPPASFPSPSPSPSPPASSPSPSPAPGRAQTGSSRSAKTKILAISALVVEVIIGLLGNLATGGVLSTFCPIWLLLIATVAIGIILIMFQP